MRYREMRFPCHEAVTVVFHGEERLATLANVSASGACIEGLTGCAAEDQVTLRTPAGSWTGEVRRVEQDSVGLRFLETLSPWDLMALRRAARPSSFDTSGLVNHGFREMT